MSYGTDRRYASKKALREDVESRGADKVGVFGTSIFGNETASTVADLAGTSEVIVGPDVYTDRKWYANVKVTRDGKVVIR